MKIQSMGVKKVSGFSNTDLTITQSSKIIDLWLGSWIKSLAENPSSVKIVEKNDGVIELQDNNGQPNCMIYEVPGQGFVFTKASIPIGKNTPTSKNKVEMKMAFYYAEKKEKYIRKCIKIYQTLPTIIIIVTLIIINLLIN